MSLFKKLNELKILCDVETCGDITDRDGTKFEVWFLSPETTQIVQRFMNLSTSSQTHHMVDQNGFLMQYLEDKKVQSLKRGLLIVDCLTKEEENMSNSNDLHDMLRPLERKIGMVYRKISHVESLHDMLTI